MINEKSLKNLRPPFEKGNCANPNGRPKGVINLTTRVAKLLESMPEGEREEYADILAKRILHLAIKKGYWNAIKEIWDRLEGKPIQRNEVSGPEGDPLQVQINMIPASTLNGEKKE